MLNSTICAALRSARSTIERPRIDYNCATILAVPPSPIVWTIARVANLAALLRDTARRVRWVRADLRRIPLAEMTAAGGGESFRWRTDGAGVSRVVLECPPDSRVAWEVTLPPNARVVCGRALSAAGSDAVDVEFEIQVRTTGHATSVRCVVGSDRARLPPRSRRLQVRPRESGPARIVLSTRLRAGTPSREVRALWLEPRIEAPRPIAGIAAGLRAAVSQNGISGVWRGMLPLEGDRLYRLWVREREPSRDALRAQAARAENAERVFSLITVVTHPSDWNPRPTITSLAAQSYPHWEWIVVAGPELSRDGLCADARVRLLSDASGRARAAACNHALGEARGEFLAVLGQSDTLSPSALYEMAAAIDQQPDLDVVYSDEDRVSVPGGRRHTPRFKPDWSPELLLSCNYVGRLAMIRAASARTAGGFREGLDGLEEWELLLRLSRAAARFRRLPRCLYHRVDLPDSPVQVRVGDILREHYEALGLQAESTSGDDAGRVTWRIQGLPKVSIIVPNRNAAAVLRQCAKGLLEETTYAHRELVIVDDGSTDPEVLDFYRSVEAQGRARIIPLNRPFNFSAACNAGAAAAGGELLLFLNNDIEVIHPDWLHELVRCVRMPGVGVVGAKLLYPDRTIQHAGVVFGLGLVGHIFSRAAEGTSGVFGSSDSYRNYLAVTGACQMIRKDVFAALGGYDERFRLSFSDVVLCLEAWKAGYRVVYTPYSRLVHHESYTRKREDSPEDMEHLAVYLRTTGFVEDPYFHPELDARSPIPAVRPPFDPAPAQVIADYIDRVLAAGQVAAR